MPSQRVRVVTELNAPDLPDFNEVPSSASTKVEVVEQAIPPPPPSAPPVKRWVKRKVRRGGKSVVEPEQRIGDERMQQLLGYFNRMNLQPPLPPDEDEDDYEYVYIQVEQDHEEIGAQNKDKPRLPSIDALRNSNAPPPPPPFPGAQSEPHDDTSSSNGSVHGESYQEKRQFMKTFFDSYVPGYPPAVPAADPGRDDIESLGSLDNETTRDLLTRAMKHGYMEKYAQQFMSMKFKRRYFVLSRDRLLWFKRKGASQPMGAMKVSGVGFRVRRRQNDTLEITSGIKGKTYLLRCSSTEETTSWLQAFQTVHQDYEMELALPTNQLSPRPSLQERQAAVVSTGTGAPVHDGRYRADSVALDQLSPQIRETLTYMVKRGAVFLKYKRGRPKLRLIWVSECLDMIYWSVPTDRHDIKGQMQMAGIVGIEEGCHSAPRVPHVRGMTICSLDRTLELVADDQAQKTAWVTAFSIILKTRFGTDLSSRSSGASEQRKLSNPAMSIFDQQEGPLYTDWSHT